MKIEIINITTHVVEVYPVGIQGAKGADGSSTQVISEASANKTITDETYLILKGANALNITLKDPNAAQPITILNQADQPAIILGPILNGSDFTIVPGNVYQFVPQGGIYYVD